MSERDERWQGITGHPDYEVSDLGRVRSWRKGGRVGGMRETPRILKVGTRNGYFYVWLSRNGKQIIKSVHRLVLVAFKGEPPVGMVCCHFNGDPHDNRLSNLRWDTRIANAADDLHNGVRRGAPPSKLTENQVLEIRASRESGVMLAQYYGVTQGQVSHIRTRRAWAWLKEEEKSDEGRQLPLIGTANTDGKTNPLTNST